jgi:proteasome assembly chaperone (PAC2) family protein
MNVPMEELPFLEKPVLPRLRRPVLVAAFAGWNDAAQAATFAVETLLRLLGTTKLAEIDPEEFYDFTAARPMITLTEQQRALTWPQNRFFAHRLPASDRDLVIFLGVEPQLKWRSYCGIFTALADEMEISQFISLGALLAEVPHTIEPKLTGFASGSAKAPNLESLGVDVSSYEGPTGIIGALHASWLATGRPAVSLWGNVPHYISATPNPAVALALLQRVGALLVVDLPLEALELRATAFRTQIDEALQENPEAREYVEQLEAGYGTETPPPAGPELIDELERYLRGRRPRED